MSRSRADTMRRRKAERRRKLLFLNMLLLAGIAVVAMWNVWAAGNDAWPFAGRGDPRGNEASTSAPGVGAEAGDQAKGGAADGGRGNVSKGGEAGSGGGSQAGSGGGSGSGTGGAAKPEGSDAAPAGERGVVKLAFVGDVLLGEYVGQLLAQQGYDYPYAHVGDKLRAADLAIANLETAITDADGEKPGLKTYEFRSDPAVLPAFREAGFDLVNLANNHTLDFGPDALRDTMRHLKENGILHVGAGETADEAFQPAYIEANGLKIAVLGVSRVIPDVTWKAGKNTIGLADTYNYTRPVEEIKKAAEQADIVVVLAHWGEEGMEEPHPQKQVELGRRFIDAGADLIVGSHPHVLQGVERYGNGWIAYSLGNFIFTKSKNPLTYDTAILEAACTKEGCELQWFPFRADTPQPQPMDDAKREALLAKLSGLSIAAEIRKDGTVAPTADD